MSNPFIFNDSYPDADYIDYNGEELYEMGVSTGIKHGKIQALDEVYKRLQFGDIEQVYKYLEEHGVPQS